MGSLTLTDIPYEVFTDHILPLCSLKELGALSMVATELWPLGKDESLWKYFYIQGLKGAIPKDRVIPHVGLRSLREFRSTRKYGHPSFAIEELSSEHKQLIRKRVIRFEYNHNAPPHLGGGSVFTGHLLSSRELEGFDPIIYDVPNSKSYNCGIRWGDLTIPHSLMCWSSLPPHCRRRAPWYEAGTVGTPQQQGEFAEQIKADWIEYNRSRGLSTVNLCNCPNHYREEDLDLGSSKRKSKSYRKLVLKKMKTKQKKNGKRFQRRNGKCIVSKKSIEILLLEDKLEKLKKERDGLVDERERLNRLGESLENALQ